MKKILVLLVAVFLFSSCVEDKHVTTEFYVKNTSTKTITFHASVIKYSQLSDPIEVSLPFTVYSNDSVLARRASFERDGKNPQNWFSKFAIDQIEGIEMNNPNLAENWIKSEINGTPIYVFTLNKD